MEEEEEKPTYKVVLIGESGVGKTCIIAQFINNTFDPDTITSSAPQYIRKEISFKDGNTVIFDIWDTAGQEKYRAQAKILFKNAKVVILVYDITDIKSFQVMKEYWYPEVQENGLKDVIYAVAANKSDLYEQQKVKDEEGQEFAKSIDAIFESTSAKNDSGIQSLFENIANKIIDPNFDFAKNKEKKIEEFQKEKMQGELNKQKNQNLQPTKSMKLRASTNNKNKKEKKKKKCC